MAELREITSKQLQKILEEHRKWVESKGKEGKIANLQGANLQKANLGFADLQEADLEKANLQGAFLQSANLQGAKLFGANLQGANLLYANLEGSHDLPAFQVKSAKNWQEAFYSDDLLGKLGLPNDHNERLKKRFPPLGQ